MNSLIQGSPSRLSGHSSPTDCSDCLTGQAYIHFGSDMQTHIYTLYSLYLMHITYDYYIFMLLRTKGVQNHFVYQTWQQFVEEFCKDKSGHMPAPCHARSFAVFSQSSLNYSNYSSNKVDAKKFQHQQSCKKSKGLIFYCNSHKKLRS